MMYRRAEGKGGGGPNLFNRTKTTNIMQVIDNILQNAKAIGLPNP